MKQDHPVNVLLALFAVILVGLCVLCAAGKGMVLYRQSATQKSILKGVESISAATLSIDDALSDILERASYERYDDYRALASSNARTPMKESLLDNYFREAVLARFIKETGGEEGMCDFLSSLLPTEEEGELFIDPDSNPAVSIQRDADGNIVAASVQNVCIVYEGIPGTRREEEVRFDLNLPEVVFYGGSDELSDYCMMAGKGIYATGATSSFVGDIYAGSHTAQESRDMEVAYGEIGAYGGMNFLSTQVGIEAENIISCGDINLSGSFVIFNSSEEKKLSLYAEKMRKMRGYTSDSMYSVDGDLYESGQIPEEAMDEYLNAVDFAQLSISKLYDIPFYYDSDNDAAYEGEYRKIISSEDVEISEDVTGLILTGGNVIINTGCNVEGLILCGDRIYIQGNNSIVSNPQVVKSVLSDEIADEDEDDALSEDGGNETEESGINYFAKDYIGGFTSPGIKKQDYYVVPYQVRTE